MIKNKKGTTISVVPEKFKTFVTSLARVNDKNQRYKQARMFYEQNKHELNDVENKLILSVIRNEEVMLNGED